MSELASTFQAEHLHDAWSLLSEYYSFCRLARHRRKLEEQLHGLSIPLTHVPWKSMVRAILCQHLFTDEQLKEMTNATLECCAEPEIVASQAAVNKLLESSREEKEQEDDLSSTWFEVDELKQRFKNAVDHFPRDRQAQAELLNRIQGYPIGYVHEWADDGLDTVQNNQNKGKEPVDLALVLTADEQDQMDTGDLIELSGYRLHEAFYVYRLPQKGTWSQIQQMWVKHQVADFLFHQSDTDTEEEGEEEIILIPAKDEYGYGVPYLFATRPTELLPDGALYKYVDINCALVARHAQNSTIALVQEHLNARLTNPIYQDEYIGVEMTVEPSRFPQEYVAIVHINEATDNVTWTRLAHYNGKEHATDLNDNFDIFCSRRVLEAEEQYRQKHLSKSKPSLS